MAGATGASGSSAAPVAAAASIASSASSAASAAGASPPFFAFLGFFAALPAGATGDSPSSAASAPPPAASPASLAAAARALCSERDAAVPSLPPLPPRVASRAADAAVACVGPRAAWPVDVAPRRLSLWRDRARRRHQLARRRRAQVGRPLRSRACGGLAGDVGPLREAAGQRGDRLVEGGLPHERGRGAVVLGRLDGPALELRAQREPLAKHRRRRGARRGDVGGGSGPRRRSLREVQVREEREVVRGEALRGEEAAEADGVLGGELQHAGGREVRRAEHVVERAHELTRRAGEVCEERLVPEHGGVGGGEGAGQRDGSLAAAGRVGGRRKAERRESDVLRDDGHVRVRVRQRAGGE
mmetsp:Transcript_25120/g.82798  ORF Transcript_25120/g.82798 Transcript_25120/m.82798 type:complete len:358 (-) Transcript_25120:1070-2143(-)